MVCSINRFKHVVVYSGHKKGGVLGPYSENIRKRIDMFKDLNSYRAKEGHPLWDVTVTTGEDLVTTLSHLPIKESLLVIPAGQSSHLDKAFKKTETDYLTKEFFPNGGRGYLNCGSSYFASKKRIYDDICLENSTKTKRLEKVSQMPLFDGTAKGPLCAYPDSDYKVGFFHDAVKVEGKDSSCTIMLSGGGSFLFPENSAQKSKVLARYSSDELVRLNILPKDHLKWQTAAIMVQIGKGAVFMGMFHPYYGKQDTNTERYEKNFPNSKTNWRYIHENLSSLDDRMLFVMNNFITPLEILDFD